MAKNRNDDHSPGTGQHGAEGQAWRETLTPPAYSMGLGIPPWKDPEINPGPLPPGPPVTLRRQVDRSTMSGKAPGPIEVAIINATKSPQVAEVVTDKALEAVVEALQTQVTEHFAPAWGVPAKLTFVPRGGNPPDDVWWLVVTDNSDQAGALGYHDLTGAGLPLGFSFAGSDLTYGVSWTVTVSHELLEMLVDPYINLTVFVEDQLSSGTLFAYEVCDACEADQFGYKIGDVLVSDFVFPSWFEPRQPHAARFDWQQQITEPLQLLPGGYIGINRLGSATGWTQLTARNLRSFGMRARIGTRRERRRVPKVHWLLSDPSGTQGHLHQAAGAKPHQGR